MRRQSRRSRLLVFASLAALIAGLTVTTGPAALAADPPGGTRPSSVDVLRNATPKSRGTVDVSTLPRAEDPGPEAGALAPRPASFGPQLGTANAPGRGLAAGPAPVLATTTAAPAAAQPGWAGFDFTDTGFQPPDPWVAVGPEHVVQSVNTSIQMWDREGTEALPATLISAFDFFALPPDDEPFCGPQFDEVCLFPYRNADPRFIYDSLHGRWIGTEVSWTCDANQDNTADDPIGFLDFIWSDTADPTGLWNLFYYEFEGFLPDYPAPGTSTDKLAFTANFFVMDPSATCTAGATYQETDAFVIDWADLLANGGSNGLLDTYAFTWADDSDTTAYFTARAAVQVPATSPVLFFVVQHFDGADLTAFYTTATGSAVANNINTPANVDLDDESIVGAYFDPPAPVQMGGSTVTTNIDSRPTDAIWQGGQLSFVSTNGCTPAGDGSTRACVRVTQLNTPTANSAAANDPTLAQDFLIAENGAHHFFGGVGQAGNGTLHVAWTRSANSGGAGGGRPSSLTAYQLPGDPNNSLSAAETLQAGAGAAFSGGRWGDYVGVAQDPQVPNAVWQANQYAAGGATWATHVSRLQTGGATYVPIEPVRVLDSRFNLGVTGSFAANTAKTFDVAGFGGGAVPDDAIAVTGNVAIVGQTAAGYVAITTTATNNPGSATINFPLADIRANNVTAPLSSAGGLSAVYKAGNGKTTHIIFDVTGYFLAGTEDAAYNTLAAPIRVLDSRAAFGIGLTGKFVAETPRELEVALGTNGIPVDAVAVTANLATVGQTKAGYVAVTPTEDATPPNATMNFPIGDVRANGLTAKLTGGSLWLVYKATVGATTDLILDVTGYYLDAGDGLAFFPLNPSRIMDSRTALLSGLTGKFFTDTPRTLDTDGHWGVPEGAAAVTGNLAVVGQNAAGYVSITPDVPVVVPPPTATMNFPNGDIRANGVTVGLSAGGDMTFNYHAGSGKSTNLVLDLTGYFE
jgi:hypothetical protein